MLSTAGAGGGRSGVPSSVSAGSKAKQKKREESLEALENQDIQGNHYTKNKEEYQVSRLEKTFDIKR